MTDNFADKVLVAVNTSSIEDTSIAWSNADRFVKILQGERFGMPKSVFRFHQVFGNERMRGVAIVARSYRMMTGLLPAVILFAHNMAIDASGGIAAEIGSSRSIMKRVAPQPSHHADQRAANQ